MDPRWMTGFLTTISIGIVMSLAVTPVANFVLAQGWDQYSYPPNSRPSNISFQDWMKEWWIWYMSVPKAENWIYQNSPDVKYMREDCSFLQDLAKPGFNLPYVGQEMGSFATMTCNVPHDKDLVFLINGGESDVLDPTVPQPKSTGQLVNLVTKSNIYPNSYDITLDGHPIALTNEEKYKIQTDPFNFTLPEGNIWSEPALRPDTGVAQGWLLILKALRPGTHVLEYNTGYQNEKSNPSIPVGQGNEAAYFQHVKYILVVK